MEEFKENGISLMVECEDCSKKFEVNPYNGTMIFNKRFSCIENGQEIMLSYYTCPSCDRAHYVQIDNVHTKEIVKDASRQMIKLTIARRKGKEIPKKQSDKFKKTRKHLSNIRTELIKEYTGKMVHNIETGNEFILRFSV